MKIGEYEQMMSYLTRPAFENGTPLPKKKPYTLENFKRKADLYMQAMLGSSNKEYFRDLIVAEYDKAKAAGIDTEAGLEFIKEKREMYDTLMEEGRMQGEPAQLGPSYGVEREEFGEGTKTKLVEFVENFKLQNNRAPTIMEVADGAKSSTASIKKYLNEGVDFIKTDLSTVGKAGGTASGAGKKTGVTKLDNKAYKELQDLRIKGVSFQTVKGTGGSVSVGIRIQDPKVAEAFLGPKKVTNYFPGDAKGIAQLKNLVEQIAVSDVYANNVLPFQTDEYKRKIKRFKDAQYKKKDPFGVYKALQKYKTEVFPGNLSKEIQIQHGDAKFTTQTLSRMGLIDAASNISPAVEKAERLRNNALKTALATLDNPDASIVAKKAAAEKYNSIAKGLRGQLKGTPGQGFVNFQLLEVDDSGNYKKLKDISFDPKKGLVDSDLDLSKITKEEANELITKGKKKLDLEAVKLKTGLNLKTADKIKRPESAVIKDMIKDFEIRTGGNVLGSNVGLFKGIGETIKAIPTPTGTLALTAGLGVDPTSAIDRVALGAEAAFAPELVKQTSRITSNPIVQRFFNLGLSPQMALRAARIMSPVGVASLAGEGIYQLYKAGKAEKAKLDAMTDEQREGYLREQEAENMVAAASGGLIRKGFADGPDDPGRRQLLKILGGLTTLPFVGKFIKMAEPLAPVAEKAISASTETFLTLAQKIKALGKMVDDVTADPRVEKTYEYKNYTLKENAYGDTSEDIITKKVGDADFAYKEESLIYKKGGLDESGKTVDEVEEYTVYPDGEGKMKDVDQGIDSIEEFTKDINDKG